MTSRTWQSRAIFKAAPPCEIFVESLLHYRNNGAYRLQAFVLMPDHFHVLLTPGQGTSLERAVQFIKGGSARSIRERLLFHFHIWQRGFSDHRIRNSNDCRLHIDYIAQNPVKKHLAGRPVEYAWSSASNSFRMDDLPQGLKPLTSDRHG